MSGHDRRADDIDLFAGLGLSAIRYPVLWERTMPHADVPPDWRWPDARLGRLRALAVRPIVGLVHHGSGPAHTDLLDDRFAHGLARYAGHVAERYPWVEDWTPVNEPLTTARFSALYGHWYPHVRDETAFWRALLNQVDATRLAMKAIRRVNPAARLVQTDDLGRTYATVRLAGQAAFDNLRRWACWDLLFGRVTRHHPLWTRLEAIGLGERLRAIAGDPCPPDVVGVNHYLTSDRFLDHRVQHYPGHEGGGNGRTPYVDTEAVRVLDPAPDGLAGALREVWQRYATPIALTEVHNGSTRDEQLRWAAEAWDTAVALRSEGVDIRAVTAWSLLGSHGWDMLLTAPGRYEPGLFDTASGTPRLTALATLWRGLPMAAPRHPVASEPGWWRRRHRLIHPPLARPAGPARQAGSAHTPVLFICGATGTLGQAFARACSVRGVRHVVTGRDTLDLARPDAITGLLERLRPWGVVNATGWVRVDDAEAQAAACHAINTDAAIALARACADRGISSLAFSSDLVFPGVSERLYVEADPPAPLNAYGRSKAAMEAGCAGLPGVLVARTAAFYGPDDPHNFAAAVAGVLGRGAPFAAAADQFVTPTFVPALVDAALDLLIDGEEGLWHLAGDETLSWAAFARRIADTCGLDPALVDAVATATLGQTARRPRHAGLASTRGGPVGTLADGLCQFASRRATAVARSRAA